MPNFNLSNQCEICQSFQRAGHFPVSEYFDIFHHCMGSRLFSREARGSTDKIILIFFAEGGGGILYFINKTWFKF